MATKVKIQPVEAGKFKMDGSTITIPDESVKIIEDTIQKVYDAAKIISDMAAEAVTVEKTHKDELAKKDGEIAGWRAKADAATEDPAKLDELARDREEIIAIGTGMGFKVDDLRPLKNADIKLKLVSKRLGEGFKADEADPKFVEGVWNVIKADAAKTRTNMKKHQDAASVSMPRSGRQPPPPGSTGSRDDRPSFREVADDQLSGLHNKTQKQIEDSGLQN